MRRHTEVNLRDSRVDRSSNNVVNVTAKAAANPEKDHSEVVNAIGLQKKVIRYFNLNFGSKFDKLDHELNRDKRFLIFEAKQTPIYTAFFDKLLGELGEKPATHPQTVEKVPGSAPSKNATANTTAPPSTNQPKKEGHPPKPRNDPAHQDNDNEKGTPTPVTAKTAKKSKEELPEEPSKKVAKDKSKKDQSGPGQVVTSQNFQSIKNDSTLKQKDSTKDEAAPTGREFKRKDPVPIFRAQPAAPAPAPAPSKPQVQSQQNIPNAKVGEESAKKEPASNHKSQQSPANDPNDAPIGSGRRTSMFSSEQKALPFRRMSTVVGGGKYPSAVSRIKEDVSENDSEDGSDDDKPSLIKKLSKGGLVEGLPGSLRQSQHIASSKGLGGPIPDFALTPDQLDLSRRQSKGNFGNDLRNSEVHQKSGAHPPEHKLEKKQSEGLKKSMTINSRVSQRKPVNLDHSIEELMELSPKHAMSPDVTKRQRILPSGLELQDDFNPISAQSVNDTTRIINSKSSTPSKLSQKKGQNTFRDNDGDDTAKTPKCNAETAVKATDDVEAQELEEIRLAEERMRAEAKKAEKKIKKQFREKLKQDIYEQMLNSMPTGSKLPALFLASQHSESSLLIESVRKGIEKSLVQIEADITDIYNNNEELRKVTAANLCDMYPFEISALSLFSLKTISDAEVRDVLTTDRLTLEMLGVFRLFYFFHFEHADFVAMETMNQKSMMIEIHDLYQKRLRNLDTGDKPVYRDLTFREKVRLEDFLIKNKALFSVISDMSLKPFFHSICFYTFEILFYYGMKAYVKFMEKPREKDRNLRNSAYQLVFLLEKLEMLEGQKREFATLQRQYDTK
jgi:hypothetical protein